jgi:hypothetical protein
MNALFELKKYIKYISYVEKKQIKIQHRNLHYKN